MPAILGAIGGLGRLRTVYGRHGSGQGWDTTQQRFLSRDPIGLASGDTNPYAYVFNQPAGLVDPMGTKPQGSGDCTSNSFTAGTRVLMEDRSTKPIEQVRPGDRVMAVDGGRYLWTVGEGGSLNIIRDLPGIHHTVASGGSSVIGAGQITFASGGRVTSFDNYTGHYTPPCAQCAASFIKQGVNAFDQAGIRIPLATIRDFGGRAP